jgi:hypothetical protein
LCHQEFASSRAAPEGRVSKDASSSYGPFGRWQQLGAVSSALHRIELELDRRTKPQRVDGVVVCHYVGQRMDENVEALALSFRGGTTL